jgi:rhodanese-related sulfurtransferase
VKRLCLTLLLCLIGLSPLHAAEIDDGGVVSPPQAQALQSAGKLTIIDVRSPDEWRQTGIPAGALRADVKDADFAAQIQTLLKGDKNAPVAVICHSGRRSTAARDILLAAGFTHVSNIKEGMSGGPNGQGWIPRGLPVEPLRQP